MSLPPGWAEATLGDVVEPIETGDPSKHPNEHFTYVDIGAIDNKALAVVDPKRLLGRDAPSRARRRIRAGDVLFSTVRPYLKNIAMVPGELDGQFTSTGICVLRASPDVEPSYLFRCVAAQDFVDAMTLSSDGTMYPAIADKDIVGQCIAFPPAAEQRRIVAKLDALTVRLARAKAEAASVRDLTVRVRQTSLQQAFSSEQLSRWPSVALENVIADGLIGLVRSKAEQGQACVPYLRMGHYDLEGRLNDRDLSFVSCTRSEIKKFEVRADDVLFNTRNSVELVGKVAIWPADKPGWVYNNNILRLRFHPSVLPRFAFRYMMSPTFRQMMSEVKSATTSVAAIYQRSLYATPFPVPPITVQEAILHQLDTAFARADRLEAEASKALALIDRLEAAILAKALRGELVAQDPNDEPASVLLERIRARRAADPTAKRGRRPKLAS